MVLLKATLIKEEIGIYSRTRPTITSLPVQKYYRDEIVDLIGKLAESPTMEQLLENLEIFSIYDLTALFSQHFLAMPNFSS